MTHMSAAHAATSPPSSSVRSPHGRAARAQQPTARSTSRQPRTRCFLPPRSQIEISLPPSLTPPHPRHHTPAGRPRQRADRKKHGVGALLPPLRRQPLGGGHLGRHGGALRGHLLAPHLPHRHLQLPPRLHRAPLPQARLHEVHLIGLRRGSLLAARLLAGQEDGPRRVQPQGRLAGALPRQAQVRRRRRRRALRRLRPPQLTLRGPRRRQAALRARPARAAHEPPRPARERPHRLRHGLPLLPLLHEHTDQPPEAARLHAAPRGRRGRRWPLRHARSQSQLSLMIPSIHTCDAPDLKQAYELSPRKSCPERKINNLVAQRRNTARHCNDTIHFPTPMISRHEP